MQDTQRLGCLNRFYEGADYAQSHVDEHIVAYRQDVIVSTFVGRAMHAGGTVMLARIKSSVDQRKSKLHNSGGFHHDFLEWPERRRLQRLQQSTDQSVVRPASRADRQQDNQSHDNHNLHGELWRADARWWVCVGPGERRPADTNADANPDTDSNADTHTDTKSNASPRMYSWLQSPVVECESEINIVWSRHHAIVEWPQWWRLPSFQHPIQQSMVWTAFRSER